MINETYLENTVIYRGGYDGPKRRESEGCKIRHNKNSNSLDLNFRIASKGGGFTYISLKINEDDFSTILSKIGEGIEYRSGQFKQIEKEEKARKSAARKINIKKTSS